MQFVVDATSRNCKGNLCRYGSVMHHLLSPLFHPIGQKFQKNDSFASEHLNLAKQHWFFFKKDTYLITVYNFGVPEQHTVDLGKIVLGPPKC